MESIFKIRLKAIDPEDKFCWILYSSRSIIRCPLILSQILFLTSYLALLSYFSILYFIPDTSLIYFKLIALYNYRFFITNHKSKPGLDIYLSSHTSKSLHQSLLSLLYPQIVISYDKPISLLINRWVLSCTLNSSLFVIN